MYLIGRGCVNDWEEGPFVYVITYSMLLGSLERGGVGGMYMKHFVYTSEEESLCRISLELFI